MRFPVDEKEIKKLISLFEQHEKNIGYLETLSSIIWQNNGFDEIVFKDKNTFEKRTLFVDNLINKYQLQDSFAKKSIRWDTNLIDICEYLANPYIKILKNVSFDENDWKLNHIVMNAYTLFPYEEEYHYGGDAILKMNLGFFDQDYSYPTISLCDNEWMSLNPFEIRTMQIPIQLAKGRVLTLGLGLGYYAYMVHLKDEVKEVHIVEMDIDLINNFNKHLLPLFPHPEKIHIHKADAFYFAERIKDKDYDFIFSDLWHDVSDGLPMYLKLKKSFDGFKSTKCTYWIEGSIVTYLRTLVIGVLKDEFYHQDNDYNELQLLIKNKLKDQTILNSYDLDKLLSINGLKELMLN